MRKNIALLCCIIFIPLFLTGLFAQDDSARSAAETDALINTKDMRYSRSPVNKLGRGVINTLTCLVEIPAEAYSVSQEKDPLTGCTLGVVEGFFTAFMRAGTGIFDAVTFIIPPYDKPLMKPEYAFVSAMEKFQQHRGRWDTGNDLQKQNK